MSPSVTLRRSALLAGFVLSALTAGAEERAPVSGLELSPCRLPGIEETLRCGDLLTPENPDKPSGRTITLHVVVLPALDGKGAAAPLFDLAGGPGLGATVAASFYATDGRIHRRERDVVLLDQRGTGKSGPLRCPELELGSPLDAMYPRDLVRKCRGALEKNADLAQYTTANAAQDLDAVRSALGYPAVDLFGLSYGTRLALAYLRRYPNRARSAVLIGTLGDDRKLPLWHARNSQDVLDRLFEQCGSDASCRSAFPNLRTEWRNVLAALEAKPLSTTATVAGRAPPETVTIRRGPFGEAFRSLLLTSASQARVPLLVHEMSGGNFRRFLETVLSGGGAIAEGLYLSVTCAEDTPRITARERAAATARTFLGPYRIDEQTSACREWKVPLAAAPSPARNPDVPVLLVAGDMDYVTPLGWAREVAALFPRSRVVEIAGLGHYPDGLDHMECLDAMMAAFYSHANAAEVDTSCVKEMKRPAFAVPAAEASPGRP